MDVHDKVVVVTADEEACRRRFVKKTGSTNLDFDRRLERQWSQAKKAAMADCVLENNGSLKDLKRVAKDLFKQLSKENLTLEEPTTSHEPKE